MCWLLIIIIKKETFLEAYLVYKFRSKVDYEVDGKAFSLVMC